MAQDAGLCRARVSGFSGIYGLWQLGNRYRRGSKFGYTLLTLVLLSNLMAILLQSLCVRLGVATGRDLAQACREYFNPKVNFCLWILCEIAIAACDLAELLGSAIALQRVLSTFGDPVWGCSQLSDGASTRSLAIAKDEFF